MPGCAAQLAQKTLEQTADVSGGTTVQGRVRLTSIRQLSACAPSETEPALRTQETAV